MRVDREIERKVRITLLNSENSFLFQLKDYRSMYDGYVPMKYKCYYKGMAKYVGWWSLTHHFYFLML